jgi:hypothetical protein
MYDYGIYVHHSHEIFRLRIQALRTTAKPMQTWYEPVDTIRGEEFE